MKRFCLIKYNTTDSLIIRDWLYSGTEIYGDRKFEKAYSIKSPYTDLFTTPKLAAYLGVSESFVKRNIKEHRLPHRAIGPYYYFEEEDTAAWIEFLKSRLCDPKCRLPNREELFGRWSE